MDGLYACVYINSAYQQACTCNNEHLLYSLVDVHYHMLTFFLGYIYLGLA